MKKVEGEGGQIPKTSAVADRVTDEVVDATRTARTQPGFESRWKITSSSIISGKAPMCRDSGGHLFGFTVRRHLRWSIVVVTPHRQP